MDLISLVTLAGTFSFGVSGTLAASQRRFDLFGIAAIACVSSLGGGTIRDILVGHYPLAWVEDSRLVIMVLLAVAFTLALRKHLQRVSKVLFILDTIGIGIFTIISINSCLTWHLTPGVSVLFGVMSTIAGGILRDVLCNEVPIIFRKEMSAIAAGTGGLVYVVLHQSKNVSEFISMSISIALIIVIRLASAKYKLALPSVHPEQ